MVLIGNSWDKILQPLFESHNYKTIREFLIKQYREKKVYPSMYDIFNAFKYTPYEDVKVVILGQDPYHQTGQAHGLAFSVKENVKIPPSLANIFKEMQGDLGIETPTNGNLKYLAERGVLLLNTVLTVEDSKPNSHKHCGWEQFTDRVISLLSDRKTPMVFMLWGNNAKNKEQLIDNRHLILKAAHPSPLSAHSGFFGCKHFSKANEFLAQNNIPQINWQKAD